MASNVESTLVIFSRHDFYVTSPSVNCNTSQFFSGIMPHKSKVDHWVYVTIQLSTVTKSCEMNSVIFNGMQDHFSWLFSDVNG